MQNNFVKIIKLQKKHYNPYNPPRRRPVAIGTFLIVSIFVRSSKKVSQLPFQGYPPHQRFPAPLLDPVFVRNQY